MDIVERLRFHVPRDIGTDYLRKEATDEIEGLRNALGNAGLIIEKLSRELAECERERDLHYSRVASLIYSEQLKDVFSRDVQKWHSEYVDAVKQLAAVTKERDELKHDLERHIAAYSEVGVVK